MPSLTELFSPNEVVARVRRDVERSVLRARNGIKHVAGIDRAQVGLVPEGHRLEPPQGGAVALPAARRRAR